MGFPKHKIVGVIQCRTGSKRLPNKALLPLNGKPMLWRYIERVKMASMFDEIVLATTELQSDGILCAIADELDIKIFTGSENDLVDRIYQCAVEHNADIIVRLCADNPLIEPEEIDRIISHTLSVKSDFGSNVDNWQDSGYPDGIGAEVYTINLFDEINNLAYGEEREHPHIYARNYGGTTVKCPINFSYPEIKLDINTIEEYDYVKAIYDKAHYNEFHITDYIGDLI